MGMPGCCVAVVPWMWLGYQGLGSLLVGPQQLHQKPDFLPPQRSWACRLMGRAKDRIQISLLSLTS